MATNIVVPPLGESVQEAVLLRWLKADGDAVQADDPVAELETDKANVDIPAPAAGVFTSTAEPGVTVKVGEVIGIVDANGTAGTKPAPAAKQPAAAAVTSSSALASPKGNGYGDSGSAAPPNVAPVAPEDLSPSVRKAVAEQKLDASKIKGTGPGGRITKEDVAAVDKNGNGSPAAPPPAMPTPAAAHATAPASQTTPPAAAFDETGIRRVKMSKIRSVIAANLVRAQQTAAILTTFNEVDLTNLMAIRAKYKEQFEKTHNVGLGFMSFFVKAACLALKEFPGVNAFLDGQEVVYHDFVHMGIAVSTDRGLTVPVLRNAERLSFAKIESEIKRLATAARDGKLALPELSGGTFTITNGGVFGSLLSTPILNPPQSGILGMHSIQKRAMVLQGDKIEARSMMYVALSYDHRIVDGKESVSFLVRLKQYLEDPARLMLEV